MANILEIIRNALKEGERASEVPTNAEMIVRHMMAEVRTNHDRERRRWSQQIYDAYSGDNELDFHGYLRRFFEKPELKAHVKVAFTRKFAFAKATVFNTPPVLEVHVGDDRDDDQTELFTSIYESGRWFEALQQASRIEKILSTAHLLQRPHPKAGTIVLDVLLPHETIAFQRPGAPFEPLAIAYMLSELSLFDTPTEESVAPMLWAFWSDERNFLFIADRAADITDQIKAVHPPAGNPEMKNPYGRLPIIKVEDERPSNGRYWGPMAVDVWLAEMAISAQLTAVTEASLNQGFTLTWSTGFDDRNFTEGRGTGSHFNAASVRQGETTPTFGSVKLDSDLDKMMKAADEMAQVIGLMRGVNPRLLSVRNAPESGISKMVDLAPDLEEREGDQERWNQILRESFDLLKVVWASTTARADFTAAFEGQFSDEAELFISWPEPKVFESEKDRLDRMVQQIGMGLMSKVEAMMEIDPDLSKEQAEARLVMIAEDTREVRDETRTILGDLAAGMVVPPTNGGPALIAENEEAEEGSEHGSSHNDEYP